MNSNDDSLEEFFKNNELRVNKFLSKAIMTVIPVYPLIIVITLMGNFPKTNIVRLIILAVVSSLTAVSFYLSNKKNPDWKYNKYLLIFFINIIIFLLSIEQGLQITCVYVLAPVCASLYFDEKFTIRTFSIGNITLILSYIVRANIITDNLLRLNSRTATRLQWALAYIMGNTIEYIIFGIACLLVSREVKKLIINVFNHRQNVKQVQEQITIGFSNIVEAKEGANARSIKLTTEYLKIICHKLVEKGIYTEFLTPSNINLMTIAVPFHDIGKVSIPKEILDKTGKLTEEEYNLIKYHPIDSADFISKKLSVLNDAALINIAHDMALYHHERIDGNGYPYKLKGDSIPISARIMSAADILDALLSKRSYKEAYSVNKALQIIKEISGKAIDKNIAEVLLESSEEITFVQKGGSYNYE